jgi:hypothetical protein
MCSLPASCGWYKNSVGRAENPVQMSVIHTTSSFDGVVPGVAAVGSVKRPSPGWPPTRKMRPRLSARYRFSQGSFAGTRDNGRDAPKAVTQGTMITGGCDAK